MGCIPSGLRASMLWLLLASSLQESTAMRMCTLRGTPPPLVLQPTLSGSLHGLLPWTAWQPSVLAFPEMTRRRFAVLLSPGMNECGCSRSAVPFPAAELSQIGSSIFLRRPSSSYPCSASRRNQVIQGDFSASFSSSCWFASYRSKLGKLKYRPETGPAVRSGSEANGNSMGRAYLGDDACHHQRYPAG